MFYLENVSTAAVGVDRRLVFAQQIIMPTETLLFIPAVTVVMVMKEVSSANQHDYATAEIARLLSLELFILGVQAKKLYFCNLELILNKTGYSHIMENKKIFFHFLTWEPVGKNLTLLVFSNFLRNPPECLYKKIRNS